jgi:hypothetical protein
MTTEIIETTEMKETTIIDIMTKWNTDIETAIIEIVTEIIEIIETVTEIMTIEEETMTVEVEK